ncbi:unnamed protein product [Onchocerca ochengi]|uniref:Phorbol-ester/DAG-type domain-containing protein n=1 Tax=Onchocerca ochengi TaxID=42157 RepID=A0A182ELT7_ONCOC|nr:unnamed protein product [Onchocerca ochengi]
MSKSMIQKASIIIHPDDRQEKILIEKLVVVINNALTPLSLRLVQADDEYDDQNSYIILLSDRRPNDLLRDAFGLTQTEFALFHLWVNAICSSENDEILKCEAFSIASDLLLKGKKVDEEHLLQQFVSNKWLAVDNERATIRLDTRGIAELQNYFSSHADELKLEKCIICGKFIVMKNRAVFCRMCGSFSHRQCGLKMIKSVKTKKLLCPGKLENGDSCTAGFHISVEMESVNQNQKGKKKNCIMYLTMYIPGSRRHCIVNDFDEQNEYDVDFCSTENMHDAEILFWLRTVMDFKEVDLETPAGTLADSLAQIFMLTTRDELRQQAYQMVGAKNNRDFALAVEARLNEYFESKQRKLDRRSVLQIRQEKDAARVILEHFLKMAGLPPDAVEKFSSKK